MMVRWIKEHTHSHTKETVQDIDKDTYSIKGMYIVSSVGVLYTGENWQSVINKSSHS